MNAQTMNNFDLLINEAKQLHGSICHGLKIGTRMTMSGLARIGITDPKGTDRQKLLVCVEIDRCPTDAIMALTGCRPGKRSMKVFYYGKMAATFLNLETGKAVRVAVRGEAAYVDETGALPDIATIAEEKLFTIEQVAVSFPAGELPGQSQCRVLCTRCGEMILDGREEQESAGPVCIPCQQAGSYYQLLD